MTDVDLLRTNTSHESAPHYFNDGNSASYARCGTLDETLYRQPFPFKE